MIKESIEAYINYGVNKKITLRQLKLMPFGMIGFYIIGIFFGFMSGGSGLVLGIVILIVTFVSIIYFLIKIKELTIKNYCIGMGIIGAQTTINLLMLVLILTKMLGVNLLINIVIFITPIVIFTLYFVIIKNRINKCYYINHKKNNKNSAILFSSVWGIMGMGFASKYLKNINQVSALSICIILSLFLSSIFSFGCINFLKIYYIKKYNFQDTVFKSSSSF